MIEPQVQWVAPAPLWPGFARATADADRARLRRPDILRFATDSFMDEFMGALAYQPERLHEWRVQPETWETPAPDHKPILSLPPAVERVHRLRSRANGLPRLAGTTEIVPALGSTAQANETLKLYQPGHQRFYLITACLVCRIPGMPDRVIDSGSAEKAGYVIRRLRPKIGTIQGTELPRDFRFDLTTCDEYAFVEGRRWEQADEHDLVPGEEVLPMFGVTYVEHDGRRRRVLAGTIPVARRETYLGAAVAPILPPDNSTLDPVDPRKVIFQRKVADPWRAMLAQYDRSDDTNKKSSSSPPPDQLASFKRNVEDQANLLSWLILLDFADFLKRYLPAVWDVVTGHAAPTTLGQDQSATDLYNALVSAHAVDENGTSRSFVEALVKILDWRVKLESATAPYSTDPDPQHAPPPGTYPDFVFPLQSVPIRNNVEQPTTLDDRVAAALKNIPLPDRTPPLPLAATTSSLDFREPGWFIIRCVFDRPNCVPLTAPLLSEPTDPFQMATFFDSDAPARPVRIALPIDISPAGLRKFDRNTAFLISDALCKVLPRGKDGMTFLDLVLSVLPWPLHKDLPTPPGGACQDNNNISFGLICSLSIPIITICALILLMIIVGLLDIIFHWIPYFIMCFPLPHFSAKRSS